MDNRNRRQLNRRVCSEDWSRDRGQKDEDTEYSVGRDNRMYNSHRNRYYSPEDNHQDWRYNNRTDHASHQQNWRQSGQREGVESAWRQRQRARGTQEPEAADDNQRRRSSYQYTSRQYEDTIWGNEIEDKESIPKMQRCKSMDNNTPGDQTGILVEEIRELQSCPPGNDQSRQTEIQPLQYDKLCSLLHCGPDEVIFHLIQRQSGLEERLNLPMMQPQYLSVFLKILTICFKSTIHRGSQNYLMGLLQSSKFFNSLSSLFSLKDNTDVFENVSHLLSAIMERMPAVMVEDLESCIKMCAAAARGYNNPKKPLSPKTLKQLNDIEVEVKVIQKARNKAMHGDKKAKMLSDSEEEPDNEDSTTEETKSPVLKTSIGKDSGNSDSEETVCQESPRQNLQQQDYYPTSTEPLKCLVRLDCGHVCPKARFPLHDGEHESIKCQKKCLKVICERGHRCKNLCHQPCGECDIMIVTKLSCGHAKLHACSKPFLDEFEVTNCTKPCSRTLPCGHPCKRPCCSPCGNCDELVKKTLECGHEESIPCNVDKETIPCNVDKETIRSTRQCLKILPCGHRCKLACSIPCRRCEELVEKDLHCRHKITVACYVDTGSLNCSKPCEKLLPCGHGCSQLCGTSCDKTCKKTIKKTATCGHEIDVECHLKKHSPDLLAKKCKQPCNQELPCTHKCAGTCSECHQGRIHIPCNNKCSQLQPCGHPCNFPCSSGCPPCNHQCPVKCEHSSCPKKCGLQCQKCREFCGWKCRHYKCSMMCYEQCDRPRCDEPCRRVLPCGHSCIGLCGELCPKMCRICNREELEDFILSGFENEPNAHFVQLIDCNHCIEVRGLDRWMDMPTTEVLPKCCPRCTTPIWNNHRYGNVIKSYLGSIAVVKEKLHGTRTFQLQTVSRLIHFLQTERSISVNFPVHAQRLTNCLQNSKIIHKNKLECIEAQMKILNQMVSVKVKAQKVIKSVAAKKFLDETIIILVERLMVNDEKLTDWERVAICRELKRSDFRIQLMDIEEGLAKPYPTNQSQLISKVKHLLTKLPFTDSVEQVLQDHLKKITNRKQVAPTNTEQLVIATAMNLGNGHWYKCPKGHVYCVGGKGEPQEVGRCYECGACIGGTNFIVIANISIADDFDNLLPKTASNTKTVSPQQIATGLTQQTSKIVDGKSTAAVKPASTPLPSGMTSTRRHDGPSLSRVSAAPLASATTATTSRTFFEDFPTTSRTFQQHQGLSDGTVTMVNTVTRPAASIVTMANRVTRPAEEIVPIVNATPRPASRPIPNVTAVPSSADRIVPVASAIPRHGEETSATKPTARFWDTESKAETRVAFWLLSLPANRATSVSSVANSSKGAATTTSTGTRIASTPWVGTRNPYWAGRQLPDYDGYYIE